MFAVGMHQAMNVDYLRVSVTDRCNLRCVYCSPLGTMRLKRATEILSFEEIWRVVRLSVQCGVKRVRLTGGEPLMREGIVPLVQRLARMPGIEEVTLTTNGILLGEVACDLKEAGLGRVNISLDAADRRTYERITGSDSLPQVIDAVRKAVDAGLTPVRINCVVMKGVNVSEVSQLAHMSLRLPVSVRFIEYCPTNGHTRQSDRLIPNDEVRGIIESQFGPLRGVVPPSACGPAVYFKIEGAAGTIGFISGRSTFFCGRCSRLRLSSDGKMKPCLYSACSYDIRRLLRDGADDAAVLSLIRSIIVHKNRYTRLDAATDSFSMQSIGG